MIAENWKKRFRKVDKSKSQENKTIKQKHQNVNNNLQIKNGIFKRVKSAKPIEPFNPTEPIETLKPINIPNITKPIEPIKSSNPNKQTNSIEPTKPSKLYKSVIPSNYKLNSPLKTLPNKTTYKVVFVGIQKPSNSELLRRYHQKNFAKTRKGFSVSGHIWKSKISINEWNIFKGCRYCLLGL